MTEKGCLRQQIQRETQPGTRHSTTAFFICFFLSEPYACNDPVEDIM